MGEYLDGEIDILSKNNTSERSGTLEDDSKKRKNWWYHRFTCWNAEYFWWRWLIIPYSSFTFMYIDITFYIYFNNYCLFYTQNYYL